MVPYEACPHAECVAEPVGWVRDGYTLCCSNQSRNIASVILSIHKEAVSQVEGKIMHVALVRSRLEPATCIFLQQESSAMFQLFLRSSPSII